MSVPLKQVNRFPGSSPVNYQSGKQAKKKNGQCSQLDMEISKNIIELFCDFD